MIENLYENGPTSTKFKVGRVSYQRDLWMSNIFAFFRREWVLLTISLVAAILITMSQNLLMPSGFDHRSSVFLNGFVLNLIAVLVVTIAALRLSRSKEKKSISQLVFRLKNLIRANATDRGMNVSEQELIDNNSAYGMLTAINALEKHLTDCSHQFYQQSNATDLVSDRLKDINAELHSSNEELQCTNEELKTTSEELRCSNEELASTNVILSEKIEELKISNVKLNQLMLGLDIPIIFLDQEGRILKFSERSAELFSLIEEDSGRRLNDFQPKLKDISSFQSCLDRSRDTGRSDSKVVESVEGIIYDFRVCPFHLSETNEKGLVLMFIDITPMTLKGHPILTAVVDDESPNR
tara:strand:+ start:84 stop:1142 length:1059 start_codon:yes stop_codon:yes gene_type:complete